mgnify:CR=1 FL=1
MSEKRSTSADSISAGSPEGTPPARVIPITSARRLREREAPAASPGTPNEDELEYRAKILGMDKLELLEEMVRFQQERSSRGDLTLEMMGRGRHLFQALEEKAETQELRLLARSYRRHLDHEISARRRAPEG